MTKKHVTGTIIFLFFLIGFLHLMAVVYTLYWKIIWFDIPMHFLGGMFAGFVGLSIYYYYGYFQNQAWTKKGIYLSSFVGVLFIGITWELYEYFTGQTFVTIGNYSLDVFKDMVFDILGGLVSSFYFLKRYNFNKNLQLDSLNTKTN